MCLSGSPDREPEDVFAEDLESDNRVDIPDDEPEGEVKTGIVVRFKRFDQPWEFELVEHIDDEHLEPFSMPWMEAVIASIWEEAEQRYIESRDETP